MLHLPYLLALLFTLLLVMAAERDSRMQTICSSTAQKCTTAAITNRGGNLDEDCERRPCPSTAFCFLGSCPCHPGYSYDQRQGRAMVCSERMRQNVSNRWFTDCPNLRDGLTQTFDADWPLSQLGGEHDATKDHSCPEHLRTGPAPACAYLCFAHDSYGVAVVPKTLWVYLF
jgi:hypothetical protein